LQSYYDILGIQQTADNEQIKSAFRRLAKLYHPDKNPQGKDEFEKILIAYETLIDPSRRRQYDLRLKRGISMDYNEKRSATKKQKEWSFSDEELKRRQYYKEHYKKEFERHSKSTIVHKKNYNEYKYILFAAPIAVGLFMFIVNAYEQNKASELKKEKVTVSLKPVDELKLMDDPFTSYFKNPVYDVNANRTLEIKNISDKDAVFVLLTEKGKFLRSDIVKAGFSAKVSQLPGVEINIKLYTGKFWKRSKEHKDLEVIGGFTEQESYCKLNTRETNGYSFTIDKENLKAFEEITEKEFFARN
jgi:hypothetical protein